jgi:hypothetical protein
MRSDTEPPRAEPSPQSASPMKSPIPFILGWFVMPLAVVLILEALGVPERMSGWVSSLF